MQSSRLSEDETRKGELNKLAQDVQDPSLNDIDRERAGKALRSIKSQTQDTRLNWLRKQMADAAREGDHKKSAEWEYAIREHRKESNKFEDWT